VRTSLEAGAATGSVAVDDQEIALAHELLRRTPLLKSDPWVQASEIALNGVREEARVGQRTTLDVLNAQQELVNARVALVSAQRDRVVASYTLLAAVGRLSPQILGLRVPVYDSNVHYQQIRDTWAGVRTPDGR
jgi:outer membrane protein